jgi:tryptophan halogenase
MPIFPPNTGLDDWHFKKILYPETPVSDYAECFFPGMALVNQNKSLFTDNSSENEVQQQSKYSYQFDATKFGIWLKDNYCKSKYSNNFTHILAEVKEIPLNDNGIKHLVLDDGRRLEADLFIDCTGFKSLLLTEAFGVSFVNINDYIPNNYAWATKIPYKDPETQIVNYTKCTAIENGWIWEIPLWSRMGSGYVFSDKFISTQAALREFKQGLRRKGYENVEALEYHLIPMRCGIQSKLWVKNTCAIGLAAGFIEPLQSNGLHCTHQFIFNLCCTLERGHISEWDRKEFTTKCHDDFYGFAAPVVMCYGLTHRDDTEYWREIISREWSPDLFSSTSDGLSGKFHQAYREKNFNKQFNTYSPAHCMAAGMNWNPTDIHSIKYSGGNMESIKKMTKFNIQQIEERKKNWDEQIKDFPSPYQYLKNNIHND